MRTRGVASTKQGSPTRAEDDESLVQLNDHPRTGCGVSQRQTKTRSCRRLARSQSEFMMNRSIAMLIAFERIDS